MKIKAIILCTLVLALSGCSSGADMWNGSGPRYTPRAKITQSSDTQKMHRQNSADKKSYQEYEQREACQRYRKPPRNYSDGCVSNITKEEIFVATAPKPASQKVLLPTLSSYTVLFDFDKSDVYGDQMAALDRIAEEIKKHHPNKITVTGYTDSQGKAEYNQTLSRQREEVVSEALLKRGIASQTLNRRARGEYEQAIKTADGVKNQKNRRVVIDFLR